VLASRVTRTMTKSANKQGNSRVQNTAPDVAAVQRSLREIARPFSTAKMHPYAHCRLDQFNSPSSKGLPDGRNTKFVTVDSFVSNNINCVSGAGFMIRTVPTLPYTAGITGLGSQGDNDISVDGTAVKTAENYSAGLFPIGLPPEWGTGWNVGGSRDDPYSSATIRLVSRSHRLIYTAPAISASGIIAVTPEKLGIQVYGTVTNTTNALVANTVGVSVTNPTTGALAYSAPANTQILNFDVANSIGLANVFTRDTITTRAENGCYIINKHAGEVFKIQPTFDNGYAAVGNARLSAPAAGSILKNFFAGDQTETSGGGIFWFDDDWEVNNIVVTGMPVGATFRFETALCFEFGLLATSAFAPLATCRSEENPSIVKTVNNEIADNPVASPSPKSPYQGGRTMKMDIRSSRR